MFRPGQFVVSRRREDEWAAYFAEAFAILGPLSDAVPRNGCVYRVRAVKDGITGGAYLSLDGLPETVIYHSGWFRLARRPVRVAARRMAARALSLFTADRSGARSR